MPMLTRLLWISVLCVAFVSAQPASKRWDLMIVHTTDVHGWIDGHPHIASEDATFGDFYSFVYHLKESGTVLLIDSGDQIEGTGLSDASPIKGQYIYPVFLEEMYHTLTVGNHDVETPESVKYLRQQIPEFGGAYVTSNTLWNADGSFLGAPYRVGEEGGIKKLTFGFIYEFDQVVDELSIVSVAETTKSSWFRSVLSNNSDVDLVAVAAHISPQKQMDDLMAIYRGVRAVLPQVPLAILVGHSHRTFYQKLDDHSFILESGRYFERLGVIQMSMGDAGLVWDYGWLLANTADMMNFTNTDEQTFNVAKGVAIQEQIDSYVNKLHLNDTVGCSPETYVPHGVPLENQTNVYNLYLTMMLEKVLYPHQPSSNTQYCITQNAMFRSPIYQGRVSRGEIFNIDPFNSTYQYYPNVTGTTLQRVVNTLVNTSPTGVEWIHSFVQIDSAAQYDLVCTDYDCVEIGKVLGGEKPGIQDYPGHFTDTILLSTFIENVFPCE